MKELEYDYEIVVPNRKFLQEMVSYIDTRPYYSVYEKLYLHPQNPRENIEKALTLIQQAAADNDYIKGARPSFNDYGDYAFEIKLGASHLGWFKKQYCNSRS